ncbi:MAG TPA: preprotein translocase subunit SecA [Candidatus Paceibacterota bacterium]|nr:preprotein translocase subunit SecA [Candidatus Paceibacterota bacterium]
MFDAFKKIFAGNTLAALESMVVEINAREPEIEKLADAELHERSAALKARLAPKAEGEAPEASLDDILPEAFALVREAARRTLGQRPFDVQLMGGIALHQGKVAEMMTGEGKTLSAVAPTYLNALTGKGAHVVTVNEYLARRDTVWMGQVYRMLGLSVACIVPGAAFRYDPEWKVPEEEEKSVEKEVDATGSFLVQQDFLKPISRREAYLADITYGTNHEFGFDYLRDNLAYSVEAQVQRGHHYAIIDEVDSILIDEARTPLIIAAPDTQSSDFYKTFARVASHLVKDEDYDVDEKRKSVSITDAGVEKVETMIGVQNIYAPEHIRLVHYLEESVKAHALFHRDKDYVVKNDEVIIVDEFTGRLLMGRRYQAGLHQAIEAKEGVRVKEESRTYGKISIQNYFRMYAKIGGMTGTAQTSAEEFYKVYDLEVESIPPNRPLARKDMNDLIYKNAAAKIKAIVKEVRERQQNGQPVLLGTTSIAKNEIISAALAADNIKHEVLNAKNNEREGAIIAQAGRLGAVTVATNVAGRGVDILLGGNPPDKAEAEQVRAKGGLHVIGTDRHEARRIDNQLRGRAGRQGDPGSSQFFLSLEDDLLRIFGGDRIKSMMERLDLPEDQPIEFGMVTKAVAQAQEKVEGANFDLRKHLLDYDDVLNKQRGAIYKKRQELLGIMNKEELAGMIRDAATAYFDGAIAPQIGESAPVDYGDGGGGSDGGGSEKTPLGQQKLYGAALVQKIFQDAQIVKPEEASSLQSEEDFRKAIDEQSEKVADHPLAKNQMLGILDMLWMTNLEDLDAVQESVGLRAYGQRDPLVEYRQESSRLFKAFWNNFDAWIFMNIFKLLTMNSSAGVAAAPVVVASGTANAAHHDIGRNDRCPCGSGKKWKKCGLLNTAEHQKNMASGGRKHEVTGG